MEVMDADWHKSFIGTYIPVRHPMFSVRLLFLLVSSLIFMSEHVGLRLALLAACIVLNAVLLRRKALALVRFLLLSTVVLLVVWCIMVRPGGGPFGWESCLATLASAQLHHALIRLWGLFAIGQLFAGTTCQYELLVFLRRVKANYIVSVFMILVGNSFAYFIQLYNLISEGFRMRCRIGNPFTKVFHVLTSLMLNALSLISGCRKVDLLYENRIRNSILRTGLEKPAERCRELRFRFENVLYPEQEAPIIRQAAMEAKKGDIILLTGANGSGKTTLLNLISGVIPNIYAASYEGGVENAEKWRNQIGLVFQSVENELFFHDVQSQLCHLPPDQRDTWLSRFHLDFQTIRTRSVMDFSSGEQQRLALIAELLDDTHALCLLDEPTAFLDTDGVAAFGELLSQVRRDKIVIIVSHDPSCIPFANRFITIHDGVLIDGRWENDFAYDSLPISLRESEYTLPQVAADGRAFSFRCGEVIGIVGPNGCGKTTMGRKIFHALAESCPKLTATMTMQHSEHQLFESSVLREMLLGLAENEENIRRAHAYLAALDMDTLCDQPAQFLSGGQKRMLVILCLLMQRPDVIILDEPFSSLDARHAKAMMNLLADDYAARHPAIIICDQSHSPLTRLCSRLIHP